VKGQIRKNEFVKLSEDVYSYTSKASSFEDLPAWLDLPFPNLEIQDGSIDDFEFVRNTVLSSVSSLEQSLLDELW
jgi:hypothetical protein